MESNATKLMHVGKKIFIIFLMQKFKQQGVGLWRLSMLCDMRSNNDSKGSENLNLHDMISDERLHCSTSVDTSLYLHNAFITSNKCQCRLSR